jgi:hypothetical protein
MTRTGVLSEVPTPALPPLRAATAIARTTLLAEGRPPCSARATNTNWASHSIHCIPTKPAVYSTGQALAMRCCE